MPLIETKGAASAQGFGLSLGGAEKVYIEDVFSTYLYTGNASTQTITNGINLSTKGGLVWLKSRNYTGNHRLFDTNRGATKFWYSNLTDGEITNANSLTAFNANGFSLGNFSSTNDSSTQYASWTFRKQPKFFDVVTYTGAGGVQTVNHNLGSAPGCIIIKVLNNTGGAVVYHRAMDATIANQYAMSLNSIDARTQVFYWNNTSPTSTSFTVAHPLVNNSGTTYVAYLFAHDAGGFGLSGTDNVISCGSFVASGSGAYGGSASVNLGWEPQWVLMKEANNTLGTVDWTIVDNMRGWPTPDSTNIYGFANKLSANLSNAATNVGDCGWPTSTGFQVGQVTGGATYIYIAIRRGPMKVPTSGTSVFNPLARSGNSTTTTITSPGFAPDSVWVKSRSDIYGWYDWDKLRGVAAGRLQFNTTGAEPGSSFDIFTAFTNTGYTLGPDTASGQVNTTGSTYINYALARAPGFFDVVCYTGTGAATTVNHNLGAAPELMIFRNRGGGNWIVCSNISTNYKRSFLEASDAATTLSFNTVFELSAAPTASVINMGSATTVNTSGGTYVAYLFATCPGVSKVGSYTGNGSSQTINCGFTGGARFVLIKRTDSTGDWYVWDTARGIVAGNDPHLSLNSTAAEVTTNDSIDTDSTGFIVNQLAATNINVSSATYIFLAIA